MSEKWVIPGRKRKPDLVITEDDLRLGATHQPNGGRRVTEAPDPIPGLEHIEPMRQAIIAICVVLDGHLTEHKTLSRLDPENLDIDLQALHDVRKAIDPRIVTDTYPAEDDE